jgi:hypothetical protein
MVFEIELRVEKNTQIFNCGDVVGCKNLRKLVNVAGLILVEIVVVNENRYSRGSFTTMNEHKFSFFSGCRDSLCNLK